MGQSTGVGATSTKDRTISDIMRRILYIEEDKKYGKIETRVSNFDEWIKTAVEVAIDIFPESPNRASKDHLISDVRKAVFAIGFDKFIPLIPVSKLYAELGASVALYTGRDKHYSRANVMHALRIHNDRISMPKVYSEYYLNYKYLCRTMKELRLL